MHSSEICLSNIEGLGKLRWQPAGYRASVGQKGHDKVFGWDVSSQAAKRSSTE